MAKMTFRHIAGHMRRACLLSTSLFTNLFTFAIRRDPALWVFGADLGRSFSDNPKYLFLHMNEAHPEIRSVWMSADKSVVASIRDMGLEAYPTYSLRGFLLCMKAGYVFVSRGFSEVNSFTARNATTIQLWHGIPLKKIARDADPLDFSVRRNRNLLVRTARRLFHKVELATELHADLAVACSTEDQTRMASALALPASHVCITGYPRNDVLFAESSSVWNKERRYIAKARAELGFKLIVMYMPTFRESRLGDPDLLSRYGFNAGQFQSLLEKLNAVLLIKYHPYDRTASDKESSYPPRILMPSAREFEDVYPVLAQADVLITDYSSVFFDFLLLDRPIIFAPFDLDSYVANDRQLYYDYDEVTPGPKAKDWHEVMRLVGEVTAHDSWKAQRAAVRRRFHKYTDGHSSERVYQLVKSLDRKRKD